MAWSSPEQGIEEPALARVGRSDQDDPGTARRPVAPAETPGEVGRARPPTDSSSAASDGSAQRVDVGLVDEIEVGLEMSQQVEEPVAQAQDRSGQSAGQLLAAQRRAGRVARRRSRPAPPRPG